MNRREFLAGGTAVGVTVGMAGCLSRLPFVGGESGGDGSEDDGEDEDDGGAGEATDETSSPNESQDTDEQQPAENDSEAPENESENETQPEAANPEPEPEVETNESAINESAEDTTPTEDDVDISSTELTTSSNEAAVTGTVTHSADGPLTIDLEVQFLADGTKIGRPALGGTTGLASGDEWPFEISASGSEYSEATDYEIATYVRQ